MSLPTEYSPSSSNGTFGSNPFSEYCTTPSSYQASASNGTFGSYLFSEYRTTPPSYRPSASNGTFGSYYYYEFFVMEEKIQKQKQQEEEIRKKEEEELRKKKEEIRKKQEEEQRKMYEELRKKQEEELKKKREEELKNKREEELRKQKEELRRKEQKIRQQEYMKRVKNLENAKEKKAKLVEESKKKREYYSKNYISVETLNSKEYKEKKEKEEKFTKEILSKPCTGDPNDRNTLLHVLSGFSLSQGKKCTFTNDTNNENSKFIGTMGSNKNQNCVLALDNLDDVLDIDGIEESKSQDKEEVLKTQILVIQEDIKNNKKNPVVENLKEKLGKAHGVGADGIRINNIFYGSAHIDYDIITKFEKKGTVTEDLKKQFKSYKEAKLHPLFFEESFNINDFDERGRKTFGTGSTFQVGPNGHKQTYTQPTGWERYGLKVLDGRYGDDDRWLHPFQDSGNWYRAYHGTKAASGKLIVNGTNNDQDKAQFIVKEKSRQARQADQNQNSLSGKGLPVGLGTYCTPDPKIGESYAKQQGCVTIQTKDGPKNFLFVFQVCVNPKTVKFCQIKDYWVVPKECPNDIRPYGILLKQM